MSYFNDTSAQTEQTEPEQKPAKPVYISAMNLAKAFTAWVEHLEKKLPDHDGEIGRDLDFLCARIEKNASPADNSRNRKNADFETALSVEHDLIAFLDKELADIAAHDIHMEMVERAKDLLHIEKKIFEQEQFNINNLPALILSPDWQEIVKSTKSTQSLNMAKSSEEWLYHYRIKDYADHVLQYLIENSQACNAPKVSLFNRALRSEIELMKQQIDHVRQLQKKNRPMPKTVTRRTPSQNTPS